MSTIESALLSEAEEAALGELMSGPLVGVHVRIAVKVRAMQHDLGTFTVIDHSFQWPIPALFARANTHPVALNTHGVQLDVTLTTATTGTGTGTGTATATTGTATASPSMAQPPIAVTPELRAAELPTAAAAVEPDPPVGGDVLGDGI